jgi:hypothetical protein
MRSAFLSCTLPLSVKVVARSACAAQRYEAPWMEYDMTRMYELRLWASEVIHEAPSTAGHRPCCRRHGCIAVRTALMT